METSIDNLSCIILKVDEDEFLTNEVSFVNYFERLGYKVIRGVRALRTRKLDLSKKLGTIKDRKYIPDFYFYKENIIGILEDEFFCEIKGSGDVISRGQIEMLSIFSREIKTKVGFICKIQKKNSGDNHDKNEWKEVETNGK